MKPLLIVLALICAPLPALAHKVIAAVYPAGLMIEGEIGLSDGTMSANLAVTVATPDGRALGQTQTDAAGLFTFAPTEAVDHVFHANLGAGHVATVVMMAADVGAILGKPVVAAAPAVTAPQTGVEMDQAAVATMLRDELRPLRQEIAAYKEKNDFQTILGGFGYIAGLFGLGFYIAARRHLKAAIGGGVADG